MMMMMMMMKKKAFLRSIDSFERKILECDIGYLPNPDLTAIKCDFKHKKCKKFPSYTVGCIVL